MERGTRFGPPASGRGKTSIDLDKALEKFHAGEPLTDREVGALLRSDRTDSRERNELPNHPEPTQTDYVESVGALNQLDKAESEGDE